MLIGNSLGVELELNGASAMALHQVRRELAEGGWCTDDQHDYHCRCDTCHYSSGLLWRSQRDSTVGTEFITRILHDWATARLAFDVLESAIAAANADHGDNAVSVAMNTGLHVHVGEHGEWAALLWNYLRNERWIHRIACGPFADKRDGMNLSLLSVLRDRGHRVGKRIMADEGIRTLRDFIGGERHVDLNYSSRTRTFEFRIFNSTTEAWQMELAARFAAAFTRWSAHNYNVYDESFVMPRRALPTITPELSLNDFIYAVCCFDEDLRPLIERQLALHEAPTYPIDDTEEAVEEEPVLESPAVASPAVVSEDGMWRVRLQSPPGSRYEWHVLTTAEPTRGEIIARPAPRPDLDAEIDFILTGSRHRPPAIYYTNVGTDTRQAARHVGDFTVNWTARLDDEEE